MAVQTMNDKTTVSEKRKKLKSKTGKKQFHEEFLQVEKEQASEDLYLIWHEWNKRELNQNSASQTDQWTFQNELCIYIHRPFSKCLELFNFLTFS